ncbi:gluconate 2-dehydrogenase subunit 3 family protein [Paenibacillus chartarius]|uniref:Gluconate 2-dehydrogenase subunit 3 family protein n=1 Tax=Paenibacillus chartarius TaxID=747481 RepID=A0ABV6DT06_9BACL
MFRLCEILLDERRYEVIAYVVHHLDSALKSDIGESERKAGVPKRSELIRGGLDILDKVCIERYGTTFAGLEESEQNQLVKQWMTKNINLPAGSSSFPITEFMNKILNESVAAYYSHPSIWSEIGYAGPAYPRGYVRSEFGLTDPWEARRDGK